MGGEWIHTFLRHYSEKEVCEDNDRTLRVVDSSKIEVDCKDEVDICGLRYAQSWSQKG